MIRELSPRVSHVRGVRLMDLHHVRDRVRGDLAVVEFEKELPFRPARSFWTFGIPDRQTRGEHAHRQCVQFLVCVHGSCRIRVDDGLRRHEWLLDRPSRGILVPPMVWAEVDRHSHDSVLMVLASHAYDPDDYIRDYSEFLAMIVQNTPTS